MNILSFDKEITLHNISIMFVKENDNDGIFNKSKQIKKISLY